MKIRHSLFAGAAIAALSLPVLAHAGEVAGTVSDTSNTIALRSAQVRIVELDRVTATSRDGSFLFADVPAGDYTLEITYVGAETATRSISVPATGTVREDVALAGFGDDEILVVGQAANLSSALSRKKEADGISDVLTRDAIGQFPDQNVAESLRRLPGVNVLNDQGEGRFVSVRGLDPELVSTSLNGVRLPSPESDVRSVALDVISSDIIESIEVKKSLTPDMDADTIGASVEIQTTSAFDRKKDLLIVNLEGSYNDYADALTPKASLDFATLLSDNFGVSGGVSYYRRKFETDNIEADDWIDGGGIVPLELQYRDYDVERERISGTLGFDFRASDTTDLYVKGTWSQFDDQEYRRRLTFDMGDFEDYGPTSFVNGIATFNDATIQDPESDDPADTVRQRIGVERDIKDRFERQRIWSVVAGGKTDTGTWFADYSASYARASERENGSVDPAEFRQRFSDDGLEIGFDLTDPRVPLYTVNADPGSFYDPAAYELTDIEYTALSDASDEEWAGRVDFGRRFITEGGEFTVQAGAKGRWRDKRYNANIEFYENDSFTLDQALGSATYRLISLEPMASNTGASDFFRANRDDFEFVALDSAFDSAVSDYSVGEDIMAGYLLGRWDSSTLRVIGGLRYEHTSNDIRGNLVTLVEEGGTLPDGGEAADDTVLVEPTTIDKNYGNWLPSLNVRFEPTRNVVLRLAGYRSLVRPKLSRLAPRFAVEQNDDDEREGEFGNPDLLPYKAWNFDASAEYYMSSTGAITAGIFYKSIKDYIVDANFEGDDPPFNGVYRGIEFDEAVIPLNGDTAEVFGVEIGVSQAFTFLPEPFDGFVVSGNYTYTDATGTVFTDGDIADPRKITLPATSKHTANLSLGYDKGPVDIRLSGTYRDKYLDELAGTAEYDRFVDDHFQLDLSAKFRVTDGIQVFYEWVNINNAKYFAYNTLGNQRNLFQYEEYNWTMKGGVRVTF